MTSATTNSDDTTARSASAPPSDGGGESAARNEPARGEATGLSRRPKRADARRNYEKLLVAAREAFAENDTEASLEDIARRAGVGIGTLYRHFPTRQALLEAAYVEEVEAIAADAQELAQLEPWEALSTYLRRFMRYAATKRVIGAELMNYVPADADVFATCRNAITDAGAMLLRRAQDAGVVRPDADFTEVGRMVAGLAQVRAADDDELGRIFALAIDGLRYRPAGDAA
jgi:AcrR family transcriptional regulator